MPLFERVSAGQGFANTKKQLSACGRGAAHRVDVGSDDIIDSFVLAGGLVATSIFLSLVCGALVLREGFKKVGKEDLDDASQRLLKLPADSRMNTLACLI